MKDLGVILFSPTKILLSLVLFGESNIGDGLVIPSLVIRLLKTKLMLLLYPPCSVDTMDLTAFRCRRCLSVKLRPLTLWHLQYFS